MPSSVPALYKNHPIHLWVEDEETRTYFDSAWQSDPDIQILVAGGEAGLRAIVAESRKHHPYVLGFRDRDFLATNNWALATVLRSRVFEVENLILDSAAIEQAPLNTQHRTIADIEARMLAIATPLVWWMACRQTIADLFTSLGEFISHPKRAEVGDLPSAEKAVLLHPWTQSVPPSVVPTFSAASVTQRLVHNHALYDAALASGAWKQDFCGKEILGDLLGWIWPAPPPGADVKRDFIKAVAEQQRHMGNLPVEVLDLRAELRQRAGLAA